MSDSDFDGIEEVSSSERLPRLDQKYGEYTLEVLANEKFDSRKNERWFMNSFKVIESKGEGAYPVGSLVSSNYNKGWDTTLRSVKGLVAALTDGNQEAVTKEMCNELYAPDMPARGKLIKAIVFEKAKVKTQGTFRAIMFLPYTNVAALSVAAPPAAGETTSTT